MLGKSDFDHVLYAKSVLGCVSFIVVKQIENLNVGFDSVGVGCLARQVNSLNAIGEQHLGAPDDTTPASIGGQFGQLVLLN